MIVAAAVVAALVGTVVWHAPVAAQGMSGDAGSHGRALSSYASGNAKLRRGDVAGARRDLDTAIGAEAQYFATLGRERREGEASYLVEYLTLGGVSEYRSAVRAAAYQHWKTARDLYRTYLPVLNGRVASGDRLLAVERCPAAFQSYEGTLGNLAPNVMPVLRAAAAGRWSDAQRGIEDLRNTNAGDLVRGMLFLCHGRDRRKAEDAFVDALSDYEPTTSETPNTGPVQASAIRLLLQAMGSAPSRVVTSARR